MATIGLDARSRGSPSSQPCSSGGSEDLQQQEQQQLTKKQIAANKRKAPEVDWRAIEDPAERRRQRRLAKNRVTAARSRERKKEQWGEMEAQLTELREENQAIKAMMEAVLQGAGVGLAPPLMFSRLLAAGAVVQPFRTSVALGSYWLTRLQSRSLTPAMSAFAAWLAETVAEEGLA